MWLSTSLSCVLPEGGGSRLRANTSGTWPRSITPRLTGSPALTGLGQLQPKQITCGSGQHVHPGLQGPRRTCSQGRNKCTQNLGHLDAGLTRPPHHDTARVRESKKGLQGPKASSGISPDRSGSAPLQAALTAGGRQGASSALGLLQEGLRQARPAPDLEGAGLNSSRPPMPLASLLPRRDSPGN